jgi:hypothetical protein
VEVVAGIRRTGPSRVCTRRRGRRHLIPQAVGTVGDAPMERRICRLPCWPAFCAGILRLSF